MSESAIRTEIQTILEGVTGIGVVHNRERFSRSLSEFLNIMTSGGIVNGWTIHRQSTEDAWLVTKKVDRKHTFKIRGIYALDDAGDSESTFQGILEAIYTQFKANFNLNGSCLRSEPINIDDVDTEELGGTVYHIAELTLIAEERDSQT